MAPGPHSAHTEQGACVHSRVGTAPAQAPITPAALRLRSTAVLSGEHYPHLASTAPSLSNTLLAAVLIKLCGGTHYRTVILSIQSF